MSELPTCALCGGIPTIVANGIPGCDEHAVDVFGLAVQIEAMENEAPIDHIEQVVAEMLTDLLRHRRND